MVLALLTITVVTAGVVTAIQRGRRRRRQLRIHSIDTLQQQQLHQEAGSNPAPLRELGKRDAKRLRSGPGRNGGSDTWVAGDVAEPRRGGLALPTGAVPEVDAALASVLRYGDAVEGDEFGFEDCDDETSGEKETAKRLRQGGLRRWLSGAETS
ncbi:hypothetical protein HK405_012398 [Cladochytrium tenue]|nr:hypothetical protein HK405_012398 [Cladochytrium tenue]